jgi:L-ascorbate metabolism protein UlaG (beta-lactamase superfamily)
MLKIIDGPGEYEVSGVSVIGLPTFHDDKKGELRGKNTVYVIEMDDMKIVHLGDIGHKFSEEELEELGTVDVLMIPVGGFYTIDSTSYRNSQKY